jgi:hypothetical protein
MNSTDQQKPGRRLFFKLFLVAVMFVSLTFLAPSRLTPAHADGEWNACDEAFIGVAVPECVSQYNLCLGSCSDQACRNSCLTSYQNCLGTSTIDRSTCLEGINPQPLPVEDDRWQICMLGCQGCFEHDDDDDVSPFLCYNECRRSCSSLYPKS